METVFGYARRGQLATFVVAASGLADAAKAMGVRPYHLSRGAVVTKVAERLAREHRGAVVSCHYGAEVVYRVLGRAPFAPAPKES